jgi:hypothetical protein
VHENLGKFVAVLPGRKSGIGGNLENRKCQECTPHALTGGVYGSSEGVWVRARGNGNPKDIYSRLQDVCGNVRKSAEMTGNGAEISGNGRKSAHCKWAETAGGRVTCGAWENVLRVCCGMGHEGFAVLDLRNPLKYKRK